MMDLLAVGPRLPLIITVACPVGVRVGGAFMFATASHCPESNVDNKRLISAS
jgi:hypothetical protein